MLDGRSCVAGCPHCGGRGEIERRAEDLGYERVTEWDALDDMGSWRVGWRTPSGLKCMIPSRIRFVLSTLCDCLRRERGLPLIADIRS